MSIVSHAFKRSLKTAIMSGVAASALFSASNAAAADAPPPPRADTEEIVVTGSRIVRDGYEAPTPVTVISEELLQQRTSSNVADAVNTMPALSGSTTPTNSQGSVSEGYAGLNALNLRSLGAQRTLVLLDGQRSVSATLNGVVDLNVFPQSLISRVDVVTGGASAAYGSDALSGVVNFVLDKEFVGLKGEVSGGVTTYGDDRNWDVTLTGGGTFGEGRGHFLLSGELQASDGVYTAKRDWVRQGWGIMNNPTYTATNGQPQFLILDQMSNSNGTRGGLISSGPLKGIAFGPGGTPYQFTYGDLVAGNNMRGGDWRSADFRDTEGFSLDPAEQRQSAFARVSYDVTDSVNVFAQVAWANTHTRAQAAPTFFFNNISLSASNPYLPAAVAARAQALGVTTLPMGTTLIDVGPFYTDNARIVNRYVLGANGDFNAADVDWKWDAYFQRGETRNSSKTKNVLNRSNFNLAIDAVRNPNTGAIVCRSTLTTPTNGCTPFNVFGIGVNSAAAVQYVTGTPQRNELLTQDVWAASVSGNPFSSWAGPVSVSTGVEHRSEAVTGSNDSLSVARSWFVGNYIATTGKYNVTEGFIETLVPLAANTVWAESLDLNAAARFTDYSTSGFVTTWKLGATYTPVSGIKVRLTRSRDIRAPNLLELFQASGANTGFVNDPFNNNAPISSVANAIGNASLQPEKADTTGLGVVLQPSFFPGFAASVDYWNIDIGGAIGTIANQQIFDQCYSGNQARCANIQRLVLNGVPSVIITNQPFNLVQQIARGLDLEGSYRLPLTSVHDGWDGNLTLRALATHYIKNYSSNGINLPTDTAGENAGGNPPNWRWTASIGYNLDPISVSLAARGVSSGTYSNAVIACTSGCPTSTTDRPTRNVNFIAGETFYDMSLSYKFLERDGAGADAEAFLNIKNLLNSDPVPVGSTNVIYATPANPTLYDTLGRVFRAGIRFKM